ncbi:MAG: UvrD-helicase domain-containing protein, partial [Candidatus Binatia bacterium]
MNVLDAKLSGTQLIEASAGTGKTHTVTTLFLRLLLEQELEVSGILVVTYTNAATAELRGRIRSRIAAALLACGRPEVLPEAESDLRALLERRRAAADDDRRRLAVALQSFDEAAIFTIHGFCQRVLQENAFESRASFETALLADEGKLREEIVRDFWVSRLAGVEATVVRHAVKEGLSPSRLLGLARKAIGNPDLRVLPEDVELPEPGDL